MFGCHEVRFFQVTVAGGPYQEGLMAVMHSAPANLSVFEHGISGVLLSRNRGAIKAKVGTWVRNVTRYEYSDQMRTAVIAHDSPLTHYVCQVIIQLWNIKAHTARKESG